MVEKTKRSQENGESYGVTPEEFGSLVREVANVQREHADFRTEVREAFHQLGVRFKKRVKSTEQKVEQLAEELEDTKTRDLRKLRRRVNWWKNTAIGVLVTISTGVLVVLIGHYLFHVG